MNHLTNIEVAAVLTAVVMCLTVLGTVISVLYHWLHRKEK